MANMKINIVEMTGGLWDDVTDFGAKTLNIEDELDRKVEMFIEEKFRRVHSLIGEWIPDERNIDHFVCNIILEDAELSHINLNKLNKEELFALMHLLHELKSVRDERR